MDDRGQTIGYHQLDELRATVGPILLRRTRDEVAKQLPERTDQIIRIEPTAEQKEIHESQQRRVESEAQRLQTRREKVSSATGQLVTAALSLAGELISQADESAVDASKVDQLTERLSESIGTDSEGRPQLTITLPDKESLRGLAATLAKLLDS